MCPPPRYVVLSWAQVQAITSGEIPLPFAIVDPADPTTPLAIVDDIDKPAFRLVRTVSKSGKVTEKREPVTVVLIARDGTWHRELTTLELGALQDLPWMHNGAPLDFKGTTTAQRKVIGNMIPAKVMEAVFGQMLLSSLASADGFMLAPSNWDVWVQGLRDEGYEVLDAGHGPVHVGGGLVLDDGAFIDGPKPKRNSKRHTVTGKRNAVTVAPAAHALQ